MRVGSRCASACTLVFVIACHNPHPVAPSHPVGGVSVQDYLSHALAPTEYVLSKFRDHRVVLLGEAHWVAHDELLLASLVPKLSAAQVAVLAVEWLPASAQPTLDSLMADTIWRSEKAIRTLRAAAWPYQDYLAVIRAVWDARRNNQPLVLVAAGPGPDWRKTILPHGITYDAFLAARVDSLLSTRGTRVLMSLGFHHAFTRYQQPDLPSGTKATRFNDRAGTILWRAHGEDIFTIALHHPWQCRRGMVWERCLPVDGILDCAAAVRGSPVGFDVAGSPIGDLQIPRATWYAAGYPYLRFDALVDGYIWMEPVTKYRNASLIPLDEFAPTDSALREVAVNNPFSDDTLPTRAAIDSTWREEAARLAKGADGRGWANLPVPRCVR